MVLPLNSHTFAGYGKSHLGGPDGVTHIACMIRLLPQYEQQKTGLNQGRFPTAHIQIFFSLMCYYKASLDFP